MDKIENIVTRDSITTALFRTKNVATVNLLRRAILSEIETYAIDIVIFHTNTSPRHDEVIALRLGQLVIDHSKFQPPAPGAEDIKIRINVNGPLIFTTDNIPNLPFKYKTPIAELRHGQQIICDCIVKKGTGAMHVKWRPISKFTFTEVNDGYLISFKDIGMLSGREIIEKGMEKINLAAERPPSTIFSQIVVPNNI